MDEEILKKAVAFHGMDLINLIVKRKKEKGGVSSMESPLTQGTTFRDKLLHFLSSKVDILYHKKPAAKITLPSQSLKKAAFATVTPIESFMGISDEVCKQRFFESVEVGGVLVGVVAASHSDGIIIRLLCADMWKCRGADHLNILCFCPERELPKLYAGESATSGYQVKDIIRGHVISANAQTEKIILSLLQPDDTPNIQYPKMGLISENDYPLYYKHQTQIRGLTYDELLHSILAFHNNKNISHLCNLLGISEGQTYSFMRDSMRLEIPEQQYAENVRKLQNQRIATRHVKDGVQLFRSQRYFEAIQYFNKALQLDPRHVDAMVARGALYANNENYVRAIEDFNKAVEIDPSHPNASKYLSQTLIEIAIEAHKHRKFDEAQVSYKKALEFQPGRKDVQIYLKFAQMKEPFPDISKIPDTLIGGSTKRKDIPSKAKNSNSSDDLPRQDQRKLDASNETITKGHEMAAARPLSKGSQVVRQYRHPQSKEGSQTSGKVSETMSKAADIYGDVPPPDKKRKITMSSEVKGGGEVKIEEKSGADLLADSTSLLKHLIKRDEAQKNERPKLKLQLIPKGLDRPMAIKPSCMESEGESSEDDVLETIYKRQNKLVNSQAESIMVDDSRSANASVPSAAHSHSDRDKARSLAELVVYPASSDSEDESTTSMPSLAESTSHLSQQNMYKPFHQRYKKDHISVKGVGKIELAPTTSALDAKYYARCERIAHKSQQAPRKTSADSKVVFSKKCERGDSARKVKVRESSQEKNRTKGGSPRHRSLSDKTSHSCGSETRHVDRSSSSTSARKSRLDKDRHSVHTVHRDHSQIKKENAPRNGNKDHREKQRECKQVPVGYQQSCGSVKNTESSQAPHSIHHNDKRYKINRKSENSNQEAAEKSHDIEQKLSNLKGFLEELKKKKQEMEMKS